MACLGPRHPEGTPAGRVPREPPSPSIPRPAGSVRQAEHEVDGARSRRAPTPRPSPRARGRPRPSRPGRAARPAVRPLRDVVGEDHHHDRREGRHELGQVVEVDVADRGRSSAGRPPRAPARRRSAAAAAAPRAGRRRGSPRRARPSSPRRGRCGRPRGCRWPTRCRRRSWTCRRAPAKTQVSASTIIGFSISGKLPFSSSMSPAAPTPTSVPSVSRKPIRTSVSSTGRKREAQHAGDVELQEERARGSGRR